MVTVSAACHARGATVLYQTVAAHGDRANCDWSTYYTKNLSALYFLHGWAKKSCYSSI